MRKLSGRRYGRVLQSVRMSSTSQTPLAGLRVLITRTRHQASTLADQLKALGATTLLIPTIEIAPPESFKGFDAALAVLETYDWLIFTSANAVEAFHRRPKTLTKIPNIAVIGPATARAVEAIGLHVSLMSPQFVAESLAAALAPYAAQAKMLLVRAAEARDILPDALTAAGAILTVADAYRNQVPAAAIPALELLFADPTRHPHAITFTSASTATNLFSLLEAASLGLPHEVALASIGPITSRTLIDLGHPPHVEATEPTIPALVHALLTYFAK